MESLSLVDPLEELRRLYRQACLARATGKTADADQILNDVLPAHIASVQRELGPDVAGDDVLQTAFAEEQRRVRDAEAICELLLPRLQRAFASQPVAAPISGAANHIDRPEFASATRTSAAYRPEPVAAVASAPAGAPSIADMLDSMLAQDSARSARR